MFRKKLLKYYFRLKSKHFINGNTKIDYIFEKKVSSSTLIIVFSAFPRTGYEATFNYLKTLNDINANKLFILDNFGYQNRGCYYLGENGKLNVQHAVIELINNIKEKKSYKRIICVGSSKGGYAALMFGSFIGANYIIAGAPQYLLGNYLTDNVVKKPILKSIIGNDSSNSIDKLNKLLPDLVKNKLQSKKVYLHYSKLDHTFDEHIKKLIEDLKDRNIPIKIDEKNYKTHQEIRYWFPNFLVKSLNEIIYIND